MKVSSRKTIHLELTDHDAWMLNSLIDDKLKVKDADCPFYQFAKKMAKALKVEMDKNL